MKTKFLLSITVLLTILSILDIYWWIRSTSNVDSIDAAMLNYLSVFPTFLKNGITLSYLSILLTIITMVISSYLLLKKHYRIINIVLIVLNGLILTWHLFGLM